MVMLPVTWLALPLMKQRMTLERLSLDHLPPWPIALLQLIGCVVIEEILFYYSHRLLVITFLKMLVFSYNFFK